MATNTSLTKSMFTHGRPCVFTYENQTIRGAISIDTDKSIHLCFNDDNLERDICTSDPTNRLGYRWCTELAEKGEKIDDVLSMLRCHVIENFRFLTEDDLELVQEGDVLKTSSGSEVVVLGRTSRAIFLSVTSSIQCAASQIWTALELKESGYKLQCNAVPVESMKEVTLEEIAEKFGVPVEEIRVKD